MCATFEIRGRIVRPGSLAVGSAKQGVVRHIWAGFARREILSWWEKKGAIPIDIPATRFAERSDITGKLIWDAVEPGLIIRGILDRHAPEPLIKIVTRPSGREELERFQHPRMPLVERPLFSPVPEEFLPTGGEADLFA